MSDANRRRIRRAALVTAVALGAGLHGDAAHADLSSSGRSPQAGPSGDGSNSKQVGGCQIYANSSRFGARCSNGNGLAIDSRTIRGILRGDVLQTVWFERIPESSYPELSLTAHPAMVWYYRNELKGIDPKTLTITGKVSVVRSIVELPDTTVVATISDNQRRLLSTFAEGDIPTPFLLASPTVVPVVNQGVGLFSKTDRVRTVTIGDISMRATVSDMTVTGPDGSVATCDGNGFQVPAGQPATRYAQACVLSFAHTSVSEPGQVFEVPVTLRWDVSYRQGSGGWVYFTTVTKRGYGDVQVREIQTLVEP